MVEEEGFVVPGSPANYIQVSLIIDFLLTTAGTVETTAVVLRRGKSRFDPYLWAYPFDKYDSVLVEYFKQGDSYYTVRWMPWLRIQIMKYVLAKVVVEYYTIIADYPVQSFE